jgi:mycoredoxin
MYTAAWCGDCRLAKHVLDAKGVAYELIDIETVPGAAELVQKINGGYRTIPTILFPDGRVLVEPSRRQLEAAIAA